MTSRLVLFLIFLSVLTGILSLLSYQSYFEQDKRDLSLAAVEKEQAAIEAAKIAAAKAAEEAKKPKSSIYKLTLNTEALKKAHTLYTETGSCITCHGDKGQGDPNQEAPLIAGQYDWYIFDQLMHMKSKKRTNEIMEPFLESLSEEDLKLLSDYISRLRTDDSFEIVQ